MECVICKKPMTVREVQGVEIDVCPIGHGVWLDEGELFKLAGLNPTVLRQLQCPKCGGVMATKSVRNVEVDVCPFCQSIWLDSGELERLSNINPETGKKNELSKVMKEVHETGKLSVEWDL